MVVVGGGIRGNGSQPALTPKSGFAENRAVRMRATQADGRDFNWHSHTRMTVQPRRRRRRVITRSRLRLPSIFAFQKAAFVLGDRLRGQSCPCQKHPSTNNATLSARQTKSGRPGSFSCRRHPHRCSAFRKATMRRSVVALPVLRTRRISSDRVSEPKPVCSLLGCRFAEGVIFSWQSRDRSSSWHSCSKSRSRRTCGL